MPRLRSQPVTNGHTKPRPVTNGTGAPAARLKRSPFTISEDVVLRSRNRPGRALPSIHEQAANMRIDPFNFDPAKLHPPGVIPPAIAARMKSEGGAKLAMDDALDISAQAVAWAGGIYTQAFSEGMTFLGYTYLAELAQRPEYRVLSEIPAEEMTRKWIRLESADQAIERKAKERNEDDGGEYANDRAPENMKAEAALEQQRAARPKVDNGGSTDKAKKIKELDDYLRHLQLQRACKTFGAQDGFFGRAHLYIDVDEAYKDPSELALPIGDGFDDMSKAKVGKGTKLAIRNVEAVWCYPTAYNSNDPLAPNWYDPERWFAMAKETHKTRILTGVGRPVPDLLKPAYSFGGLSLSQMAKPYVDNWLRTRQSVADLLHAFTVFALSTDLSTLMMNDGTQLFRRAELFNNLRDNRGLFMVNEGTEKLENISVPLGTLDALQAQTQEHMAAVGRTPLVKLLGIQPMGLNADSEGVMRAFYDTIHGQQEWLLRPAIHPIVGFAQLALWGEVDPEINFIFEPLKELDEKGEAEVRKLEAETDTILIDSGTIDPAEARARLAKDPGSPYHGIDPNDVPEPPEPEMPPGMGGGGGGGFGGGAPGAEGGAGAQDGELPFVSTDAGWNEGDHPRGQPGNAGQFGSGGGGGSAGAAPTAAERQQSAGSIFAKGGVQIPDVVYRGAVAENEEQSTMSEGRGVYVSTDPSTSEQWGDVKAYRVKKQPSLVDLENYNSRARDFVAKVLGVNPKKLNQEDFEQAAADIFIQNDGVDRLQQMGFTGYRLGHDVFVTGKLSDYVEGVGAPQAEAPTSPPPAKGWDEEDDDAIAAALEEPAMDAFVEADHPHAPAGSSKGGQFVSTGSGGGGAPEGGATFKSKKEHAGALLERGTTAKELMQTLGWPSISVPATARGLGMNLTKEKRGGQTFYTGTPMTAAERQAAGIAAEGAPRKKGGPAARDPETWSMMEYIASRGGIDPKDALIGDLRSVLGEKNKFIPGFGSLIRPGGLRLDKMREAVVEAGYLQDTGRGRANEQASTTVRSLLDAMDTENRGQRIYREGRDGGTGAEAERVREENLQHFDGELDAAMSSVGMSSESVTGDQRRRVLELMDREGVSDPLEALEREALEWTQNAADHGTVERIPDELPGWDVHHDTRPASRAGGEAAPF